MIPNERTFDGKNTAEVDGKVYYRSFKIDRQGEFRLIFHVISINSSYKQGIALGFSKNPRFKGTLFLNGKEFVTETKRNQSYVIPVALPQGKDIFLDLNVMEGSILLANASDYLDDYPELLARISQQTGRTKEQFRSTGYTSGFTAAHLYGNAFWIESFSEHHHRFHCNDHKMDDDFDDLIFDLKIEDIS